VKAFLTCGMWSILGSYLELCCKGYAVSILQQACQVKCQFSFEFSKQSIRIALLIPQFSIS